MSTADQVQRYAPSLDGDTRIDDMISIVSTQLSATAFGANWSEAVAALTAHILLSSPENGDGRARGPVTSDKTGKWAQSYAASAASGMDAYDALLATTVPGQVYLNLRNMSANICPQVLF